MKATRATSYPADHHCHAIGCAAHVPPKLFMCRRHWYLLPKVHRDRIWATYRPGQEVRKDPTVEYLVAAEEARIALYNLEHGTNCLDEAECRKDLIARRARYTKGLFDATGH